MFLNLWRSGSIRKGSAATRHRNDDKPEFQPDLHGFGLGAQDYPAQLAHAAKLPAPAPTPAPSGGGEPKPAPKATVYIPASSLRAKCGLPLIASEPDLDQWLSSLRKSALEELAKGNRISL